MPAQQQPHQQPSDWLIRNGPGVFSLFLQAWATSVEVFLRRDFGVRYLNWQAAAVLLLVPLYAALWEGREDLRPLFWFLGAYLMMCIVARIGMLGRHLRGQHYHSYYNGWPRLMRLFPKCTERTVKLYVEPALVSGLGLLIGNHNAPLCIYLAAAGACLHISHSQAEFGYRQRAADMHDAVIDQEIIAEQYREMRREQPW